MAACRIGNFIPEVLAARREMAALLDAADERRESSIPLNIYENDTQLVLVLPWPGLNTETLDIELVSDSLTISGAQDTPVEADYHLRERGAGRFQFSLQLPFKADAASSKASYENGLLSVVVQRPEEEQPRKINLRSSR